ncbi:imidazoleglycerol-phosphate dehydratase HisB [Candidatus Poriferisodalis sp.]|uniref:imidazoleglycerol-phosphate dehydratase HisB n=1 Tax=Candidatus Poriferisodalis sp. TaxID=3101277 RepID=UPI003D0B453C
MTAEATLPSRRAARMASVQRHTAETQIDLSIDIDGNGRNEISTGLPFFDHMLAQLSKHARFDVDLRTVGDLEIDAHHTVEDTGIAFGEAFRSAWGDKAGVRRFASITVPLDEAAVEVILDLSGRPFLHYDVDPPGEKILGDPPFDPQLCEEFWRGLVMAAGITLHIVMIRGRNTHHIIEASFKGVARAFYDAVRIADDVLPSTKGVL